MLLLLIVLLVLYASINAFEYYLEYLNYRWLRKFGTVIPPEFAGAVDPARLETTVKYTAEKQRFGIFESVYNEILLLVFIFSGLLALYNGWIDSLSLPFVVGGLVFLLLLHCGKTVLDIPFDIYSTFKIEQKYGFNTMTPKLWLVDFIKTLLIAVLLLGAMIAGALALVQWLPDWWWLPVWGFFFLFTLFFMYISPYVLEPLFNKFTPVDDPELETEIKDVMAKAGITISKVFKMDASKRTKHSNAYFSGIGKVKRIVLYDTLLKQLGKAEILAVLAHEAGHWKKQHIIKNLALFETLSLVGAFLAFLVLRGDWLGHLFFVPDASFFAKLLLLSFVAGIVTWPLKPAMLLLSRKFEREADDFACNLVGRRRRLGECADQDVERESEQPASASALRKVSLLPPARGRTGEIFEKQNRKGGIGQWITGCPKSRCLPVTSCFITGARLF